jgi:hypothetical protein
MTALAAAIERKQWELVSAYLLLGVVEAAKALPPESVVALLDLLSVDDAAPAKEKRDGGR